MLLSRFSVRRSFDFGCACAQDDAKGAGEEKCCNFNKFVVCCGHKPSKESVSMDKQFDVIVIGAGNGGLAAAANTACAGLKTLVLEQHNLPGGCATSFRRGRFEFEPSLHELCSVGTEESPGPVYQLFSALGAKPRWAYETEVLFRTIVKGPGGYDVRLRTGLDGFCQSVEEAVPGSGEAVRAFLELKPKVDEARAYLDSCGNRPNVLTMLKKHKDFMRVSGHSLEHVLTSLGVPKRARDLVSTYWSYLGVPADELNAMHYLNMLYDYVVNGAAMPSMRSHELSLSLADVICRHGGEIRYNSRVTKLLCGQDGAVIGVVAGGQELYAKQVISNAMPGSILPLMEKKHRPAHSVRLANAREPGMSMMTVYLGLNCSAKELGMTDYTIFISDCADTRKQHDTRKNGSMYILNCLNNVVPDATPDGTCTLFFTLPCFGQDMPQGLAPRDYKAYKNELARRVIRDAEQTLGISILPHIEQLSIATPATFARYLGTPQGTVYGYKASRWDNLVTRSYFEKTDYNIPGLRFCGGHYIHGSGYSCAYIIGDRAGKQTAQQLKGGA